MKATAAVTTEKGISAISGIQVTGAEAGEIIEKIFRTKSPKKLSPKTGEVLVGDIVDGVNVIDHVVVACESENEFAISCHGNPLITEAIMKLLKQHGAELKNIEELVGEKINTESKNAIEAESRLGQLKAVSLMGVRLIAAQVKDGLAKTAKQWLEGAVKLKEIKEQCRGILEESEKAKYFIAGGKAVIAGAPNSGKSTLLNLIAGRQKAIVTDIAGTTRDWVSVKCRVGEVLMEIFDTAGLDDVLAEKSDIEEQSQQAGRELIDESDIVLYVNDVSEGKPSCPSWLKDKKVLVVQNKCDLLSEVQKGELSSGDIQMSAKNGEGLEVLCGGIVKAITADGISEEAVICFTERQKELLKSLMQVGNMTEGKSIITELLNGPVFV
jgi:tRNA modification GTPase